MARSSWKNKHVNKKVATCDMCGQAHKMFFCTQKGQLCTMCYQQQKQSYVIIPEANMLALGDTGHP